MGRNRKRIAVGLSGGVDSSVTAVLLLEMGYEVIGITMEIFDGAIALNAPQKHACYGPGEAEDVEKAASICKKLHTPFHTVDLKREYREHVIHYFRSEYLAGKTPNPCIVCNQKLKFGFLIDKAKSTGIDFDLFATGHYARIEKTGGRYLLKQPADLSKDQTYFLYSLTSEQLSRTLFPLGEYTKSQVRELARSRGLETAERPESQDFIAGNDYSALFNGIEVEKGEIVDDRGNVLGTHPGIIHYTVGQRRGLGIASHRPLYVIKIDAENNRIVVGGKQSIFSRGLIARDLNFIAVERLDRPQAVDVKIRLRSKAAAATVFPHGNGKAKVVFRERQEAVCPGQSAVFYSDDTVIGGGIIENAF